MPVFTSIAHIAFRVRDLDKSLEFYEKLGFPEFLRLNNDDKKPWIVYLRVTDSLYLELFPGGDVPVERNRTGVDHLSLEAPDIDETVAHLEKLGIVLTSPLDADPGIDGNRGCWITDPDGNRIEIMEMAPDCIQFEAVSAMNRGEGKTALHKPLR